MAAHTLHRGAQHLELGVMSADGGALHRGVGREHAVAQFVGHVRSAVDGDP
jgi:hypothetical protein